MRESLYIESKPFSMRLFLKTVGLLVCLLFTSISQTLFAQTDTLNQLFRNSYSVFELQRNDLGIYRDSKLFGSNPDYHPSSVANIGMGLVSLCIAHAMDWETDAENKILTTLHSITGHRPGFVPDQNTAGFYRHFIDMLTGERAWNSEYSTIDTGILMAGALFAKTYFSDNDSIASYTEEMWNSIDWEKAIANPQTGEIFLTLDSLGNGGNLTKPFNEYMLVAWLAKKADTDGTGIASQLWNTHFASADSLPSHAYCGFSLLADHPVSFLPSFVPQFTYYLCHPFTVDSSYLAYFDQARKGDSAWWNKLGMAQSYEWGLGAGSAPGSGYHADAINNNPDTIYSPHIIGGFLPIYPSGAEDLLDLYQAGETVYTLPNGKKILWRKSLTDSAWHAPEVQGVDYASMLFGLATLPQHLGPDFFSTYNDFDCPPYSTDGIEKDGHGFLEIFPNPCADELWIRLPDVGFADMHIEIVGLDGRMIQRTEALGWSGEHLQIDISAIHSGLSLIRLYADDQVWLGKLVKV